MSFHYGADAELHPSNLTSVVLKWMNLKCRNDWRLGVRIIPLNFRGILMNQVLEGDSITRVKIFSSYNYSS